MAADPEFEQLVDRYYRGLYQFAFSLARSEADAADLTQETFLLWAGKGHQLRDRTKAKAWLFTTLYREFLKSRRRQERFSHLPLTDDEAALPACDPASVESLDAAQVLEALGKIDPVYRAAVALFYIDDCSYKEIAEILQVPIGTVKSRLSRGLAQLQHLLHPTNRQTLSLEP